MKKNKTTPYERHQTTLFSPATLSVLKDLSFPLLLPCGMTLVLTYVVSNPLVLSFSFYNVPSYNATYDFAIDRFNAIFHTRSRLDTCALNYYLFKVGCKESPVCFCGFHNETVEHFFLECPLYSSLELICSPPLLAFMLTGCLLCLKHKIFQFFCLDHHFCLRRKIMIYFFMSSLFFIYEPST